MTEESRTQPLSSTCSQRGVHPPTHTRAHTRSCSASFTRVGSLSFTLCSSASQCLGGGCGLNGCSSHMWIPQSRLPQLQKWNHLVCGLPQQQHKADEDRSLWRLLPMFLHTDSCCINCSNVVQEQLARSIKLNGAQEYQPPTQGFILHRHPHTSKNMYDESHYLQYPGWRIYKRLPTGDGLCKYASKSYYWFKLCEIIKQISSFISRSRKKALCHMPCSHKKDVSLYADVGYSSSHSGISEAQRAQTPRYNYVPTVCMHVHWK